MTAPAPGRQAMVLPGGGAYAAYGVGIMKALLGGASPATGYEPLDPDIYTGTSGGAFNAAFMVSQPGADNLARIAVLEERWVNDVADRALNCGNGAFRIRLNPLRYLDPTCFTSNPLPPFLELAGDALFLAREGFLRGVNFLLSSGKLEQRLLEFFDASQFITDEPLQQRTPDLLSIEGIRRSDKVLRVIATDWSTGAARVFGTSDLSDETEYQILLGLFTRVAAKIGEHAREDRPYRMLTIHRYHPHDDLAGPLGVLNFDCDQIVGIIERGFRDAADHDCVASQCLLPGGGRRQPHGDRGGLCREARHRWAGTNTRCAAGPGGRSPKGCSQPPNGCTGGACFARPALRLQTEGAP